MSKAERDARYRATHREEIARRQHEAYIRDPTPWLQKDAEEDWKEAEFIRALYEDEEPLDERELLGGALDEDELHEDWDEENEMRED